ncbi:MAG: hypothetical protein V5A28_08875 [Haloarculaceae archaeon]
MRELLGEVFEPNRYNVATAVVVVGLLVAAYVVVRDPFVQYSVWLVVFTIWMAWFVYVGVDYVYGTDA